jgi:fumarate hydratase subunit alpha
MREIPVSQIKGAVKAMALEASWKLGEPEKAALRRLAEEEENPVGRQILDMLVANYELAEKEQRPLCQDTGLAIVFVEVGQDVHFTGGNLDDAVNLGIREAYLEGRLRFSVLDDPILRKNTGDNTPAVIHTEIVPGDKVRLIFDAKGGGCENCSQFKMLKPAEGREGVIQFVAKAVTEGSGNPCPPVIVGVGLGGSFERACYLAKKALMRPLGTPNAKPHLAQLEKDLLDAVNRTGVGPMGLGGIKTAMAVHVEAYSCHITSLPVAVNLDCHSHRHRHVEL